MIRVKLFGSVRESMGLSNTEIDAANISTVSDVWQALVGKASERPEAEHLYCAINHQHCSLDTPVADGDEVAFFPPVTGG